MDYTNFFSKDAECFRPSPIREILKRVNINEMYVFSGGYPAPESFPLDDIKALSSLVVDKYGATAFQYAPTQGINPLRKALAERYSVSIDEIQITTASQQAIDICTRIMIDPGDVILCLNPSYLGALNSFYSYRAELKGIDYSENLMEFGENITRAVEEILAQNKKIKFLYLVPDFDNPTGRSLSINERKLIIELARKYSFLIIEDTPYRELRYEGESIESMYSLDPEYVIHFGSFSKIFAPGFRLAWVLANPNVLTQIYRCKQLCDICAPVFDQHLAAEFVSSGLMDKNLLRSKEMYRRKRDLCQSFLEQNLPSSVKWIKPEGGLFLFLVLPEHFDGQSIYEEAISRKVTYVPGSHFFVNGEGKNTIRINFSFMSDERLLKGLDILCTLIKENL